jgi:histidinol-phosphate aminotransferase
MPYPPPKSIRDSIKESLHHINRYTPQDLVDELLNELSKYNNIDKETIVLSSGSDILIKEFIFLFSHLSQLIIADPTFIIINNAALKSPSDLLKVKLPEPEFKFPVDVIENELDKPTLIVLDNPNNPTGKLIITQDEVETLLKNENVILLIDEAYYEFSGKTFLPLIKKFPNLAILRTLSKSFGLAGSGIGYLLAGKKIQEKFEGLDIMLPSPSVIGALSALNEKEYMDEYIKQVNEEKKKMINKLNDLGVIYYPSNTNFLLVKTNTPNMAKKLAEKGIYVYDASNYFNSNYIRVTIGFHNENEYFLQSIRDIIENSK